jgi:hypothetical protein
MVRTGRFAVVVLLFGLIAVGCQPIQLINSGGTGPTCPAGAYTLSGLQIPNPIQTPWGPFSVTVAPGGSVTLTNTATTWDLKGNETFNVSGQLPIGPVTGTAAVNFEASGTYTTSSSTSATFTLGSVSGSLTVNGSVNGFSIPPITLQLPSSSQLDQLFSLKGTATYACGGSPALTLTINKVRFNF